ncbi:hypothetical protein ACQEVZ_34425 [Dactylosporangium sp. CA-152071]|uniref:hypothetical protein n=1 Tax=Dactylosporangium sp. CA-152071 TaxID=3239933 RepID=UPI003D8E5D7F
MTVIAGGAALDGFGAGFVVVVVVVRVPEGRTLTLTCGDPPVGALTGMELPGAALPRDSGAAAPLATGVPPQPAAPMTISRHVEARRNRMRIAGS